MSFSLMLADATRFCRNFFEPTRMNVVDQERWTKEFLLQLITEATEVLGEINWKHHKTSRKEIDRDKLLEELIDVQKFLINLFMVWGFTEADIYRVWQQKTKKVEALYEDQKAVDKFAALEKELAQSHEENATLRDWNAQLEGQLRTMKQELDNVR